MLQNYRKSYLLSLSFTNVNLKALRNKFVSSYEIENVINCIYVFTIFQCIAFYRIVSFLNSVYKSLRGFSDWV